MAPPAQRAAWCIAAKQQPATHLQRTEKHAGKALYAKVLLAVLTPCVLLHRQACAPSSMRWGAWCSAACSLRRLSLGGVPWEAGAQVPPPDAAPHVETALLPVGRRPPGQHFWVTDDMLPDLHVALGVRADYDWERRGIINERVAMLQKYINAA